MRRTPQPTPETCISARRAYAEVLRHFSSGLLTNDQYDDKSHAIPGFFQCEACWQVWCAAWYYYDDVFTRKLKGKHQLSKETRRDFARYIVFLRSDCHPVEPTAEQVASRRKGFNVLLGAALVIVAALVATAIVNFNLALAIIAGMALLYVLACAILRLYFDAVRWLFGAKPIERTPQQAIWPFANESDYCAALQTAGYLGRSGK